MADVLCPTVVGRDEELAGLGAALHAALGGDGGVLFLTGEAGIGKSRLARELARSARSRGAMVVVGRGVPSGATTPYRPVTEALLQGLRDRPLPADPELVPWLPALGAIVPTLVDEISVDVSVTVRAEAVIQLLHRLAKANGLVMVLEDLHWADPDTLSVLEYLGNNLAGTRILCVATSRDSAAFAADELIGRLVRNLGARRLALERLDADSVSEMVRACVPLADDEVVTRVQRTADGIPFLIEEVLASPGVPVSFAESVGARLSDFPEEERSVLSVAAVLGRHFDWRLLGDAANQPPDVVTRALERGSECQLLRFDGTEFSFRHALSREAIARRLLPQRRQELAGEALRAIEAAHPQLDGSWRDLAADLALQCGDDRRAAELLLDSGRVAMERGALATAVDILGRAYEIGSRDAGPLLVEALASPGGSTSRSRWAKKSWPVCAGHGTAPRCTFGWRMPRWRQTVGHWPPVTWRRQRRSSVLMAMPDFTRGPLCWRRRSLWLATSWTRRGGLPRRRCRPPRPPPRCGARRWRFSGASSDSPTWVVPGASLSRPSRLRKAMTFRCGKCAPCTSSAPSTCLIMPAASGCCRPAGPRASSVP